MRLLLRLAAWLEDVRIALDAASHVFAMMLSRPDLDPLERFRQVGAAMTISATQRQREIAAERMLDETLAKHRQREPQP